MTMDNRTYGFNRSDAEALILTIGGSDAEFPESRPRGGGGSAVRHAMTKDGGINSRSSLTMGSATCDLYQSSSSGVLSDASEDVTVYNPFSQSVAGNRHILIQRNDAGLWVVIAEDCG